MNEGRTLTIPMVWFKEKGVAETGRQKTRNEKPELGSGLDGGKMPPREAMAFPYQRPDSAMTRAMMSARLLASSSPRST